MIIPEELSRGGVPKVTCVPCLWLGFMKWGHNCHLQCKVMIIFFFKKVTDTISKLDVQMRLNPSVGKNECHLQALLALHSEN